MGVFERGRDEFERETGVFARRAYLFEEGNWCDGGQTDVFEGKLLNFRTCSTGIL